MIEALHRETLLTAAYFEAARTHLHALAARLARRSDVIDVLQRFAPREYASGLVIESYVEAELTDGRALLWWIEMCAEPEYRVQASLALTDTDGQRTLETLLDSAEPSLPEALRTFAAAADSLARRHDVAEILHRNSLAAA